MADQALALLLADALEGRAERAWTRAEVAAELRRLHALNGELLEALKAMLTHMGMDEDDWNKPTFDQARAAIAKATGEQA